MSKKNIFDKIVSDVDKSLNENFENYKDIKKNFKETFNQEKTNENTKEDNNISFCTKCGAKMDQDDLFCQSCGAKSKRKKTQVSNKEVELEEDNEEDTQKSSKTKEEASYKCPNCGSSLESYTSNCPYCHTEIRNVKSSEAMEKFSKGLEKIRSKEMPKYDGKESLLKRTIGVDLSKDVKAREEFEDNFKNRMNEEIADYINNYPVPNSKEDLVEFMILVTSNVNSKNDNPDVIKKAWESKMEQVYKKSKITLKNQSDIKIIDDLYNSKKKELKSNKVDKCFYISCGICLYIALVITIGSLMFGLSFVFFSLGVMTILYYWINGDGTKLFKTSIILTKKMVKVMSIIFFGIALLFAIGGVIKLNTHSEEYNNYYNNTEEKHNVDVEIDFEGNLLFNRYDVKLNIYDYEVNIPHGENKTFDLKLPNGKHRLVFTGDGMVEYVDLNVKGDTRVKYKISCHSDEIKVSLLEIEYFDDSNNDDGNNDDNDNNNNDSSDEPKLDDVETEEKEETKKIILSKSSSDFIGKNYKDVENDLKSIGFKNIKTSEKETTEKNNTNDSVALITIGGKTFDANSEFDENSEVNIVYWYLKEEPKKESVSYSTNDKDSVKDGNKGIYAYKSRGGQYDIYWIIDFDSGYVYNFFDGNGDDTCDRVKIDYGNLNDYVKITWHDGNDKWSYGLHFKYRRQPDHLIVQDNDGFDLDFYSTNLNAALKVRETKTIKDY